MIQNYYPVDFEAQYEGRQYNHVETSEKMIEISKKYKDIILAPTHLPIEQI